MADWTPVFRDIYDPLKAGSIDATDTEPHDLGIVRAIHAKYKPNKFVVGDPLKTIFIARLNPKTNEERIERIFSTYGSIKRLRLVRDIVTGFSKGYAFVEYLEQRGADNAQRKANKTEVDGCEVFVDYECERTLKGWVPRRLGGGLGGRKESGQLRFGGRDRPFRKPIFENLKQKYEKHFEKGMIDSESRAERFENDRNRNRKDRKDAFRNSDRGHYEKDRINDSNHHRAYSDHSRNKDPRKYDRESDRQEYRSRDRSRERGRGYKQEKSRDKQEDRQREKDQDSRIRGNSRERIRRRSRDRSRNRKRERSREDRYRSANKYTREQRVESSVKNEEVNKLIQDNITSIWDGNEQSLKRNYMNTENDDIND